MRSLQETYLNLGYCSAQPLKYKYFDQIYVLITGRAIDAKKI
jgi:hypothetical protein